MINVLPQHEHRSIEELVNVALTEADDEIAWSAVGALQWKGNRETLQCAQRLSTSQCCIERRLAANILGQLGLPDRTFPKESASILFRMLDGEDDVKVLYAIFVAFGHLHDQSVIPVAAKFVTHPDSEVRYGVVFALLGHDDKAAIDLLIQLTSDVDSKVRDWATFGIGTISELNTPEICNALAARLQDPDDDTRGEALMGLARRRDDRVIAALKEELSSDFIGTLTIEAAELIASRELRPLLVGLREWWDVDPELLEQAIAAST